VPNLPGFAAHFRLFCMTSAGHERRDQGLLVESLSEHIQIHLGALNLLERHGYAFPERIISILATADRKALGERVANNITSVPVSLETLTHDYYDGGCFDWLRICIAVSGAGRHPTRPANPGAAD
jgi:hypothetical protein